MLEAQLLNKIPYKAELFAIQPGQEYVFSGKHPAIVFVNEGDAFVTFQTSSKAGEVVKGQFFLLPPDIVCSIRSEENNSFTYLQVPNLNNLYIHYIEAGIPDNRYYSCTLFYPLSADKTMKHFLEGLSFYIREQETEGFLIGIKTMELFVILKSCYSREDLKRFFSPILTKESHFALFVIANYSSVSSVKELCSRYVYSPTHFERVFRKVFGMPPYQWMLQKKVEHVYYQIKDTNKPLKLIATESGFASLSNFGDFCRKHFGMSPTFIRKNHSLGKKQSTL